MDQEEVFNKVKDIVDSLIDDYNLNKNIIGSIVGAVTYVILYLSKSYISDIYVKGLPQAGAIAKGLQRLWASSINAVVGVLIAVILVKALKPILKKSIR